MYTAIIVDDDQWARVDIRTSFEQLSCGFEIVAEFASAEKALGWMYTHPVDLVFTDICMTKQSGLDMIRLARENSIEAVFVIISGYDDFHYVQEAFRNQVFYYMLKPIKDDELRDLLERVSIHLAQKTVLTPQETEGKADLFGSVMAHIRQHYDEEFTLEELAQQFHVNSSYLSSLFVKKIGMSFSYYRNNLRIQRAKELLLHSDRSVSEIALEMGYGSISYFNRVFKEMVGITPVQYRMK